MAMVFCRGCGKELHDSAIACPHCGAAQKPPAVQRETVEKKWSSITSFVLGIVSILAVLDAPDGKWDSDTVYGGVLFGVLTATFGAISILGKQAAQWMAITGLILGILTIMISLGSL